METINVTSGLNPIQNIFFLTKKKKNHYMCVCDIQKRL